MVGVNPDGFTLRQLDAMAKAKMLYDWDRTAAACATVINMLRDPKKGKPVGIAELNPYRSAEKRMVRKQKLSAEESMNVLRAVFCSGKNKKER